MKIGIIGSGNVGGTLGSRWAHAGHTVTFGTRNRVSPEITALLESAPGSRAATSQEAAAECDVILLSTPWPATREILASVGSLAGKVVIDATNPLLPGLAGLEVGTDNSAAELVASWAPGARVVKAFNTIGSNIMANPDFGGSRALLFYCGDDADAKATVHALATEIGFDAEDAGPLKNARLLEPFAMLWISRAFTPGHGGEFAFQILRRS